MAIVKSAAPEATRARFCWDPSLSSSLIDTSGRSWARACLRRFPYRWYTPLGTPVLKVIEPLGEGGPKGTSHHTSTPHSASSAAATARARRRAAREREANMGPILPAHRGSWPGTAAPLAVYGPGVRSAEAVSGPGGAGRAVCPAGAVVPRRLASEGVR